MSGIGLNACWMFSPYFLALNPAYGYYAYAVL
jgi:hypothetical protein